MSEFIETLEKSAEEMPVPAPEHSDSTTDAPNDKNIFVFHLPPEWKDDDLQKNFEKFGQIESVKIVSRPDGSSRGFGFVSFADPSAAQDAVSEMHGFLCPGTSKRLKVSLKKSRTQCQDEQIRKIMAHSCSVTLFVFHLPVDWTDAELKDTFGAFGNILSVRVMRNSDGSSKGFGFVSFEQAQEAADALMHLNGFQVGVKHLKVSLKTTPPAGSHEGAGAAGRKSPSPGCTVFVFHLPNEWSGEELKDAFARHGRVLQAVVQRDSETGQPRGFGFVSFARPAQAIEAVRCMNGHMACGKRLKVSLKQGESRFLPPQLQERLAVVERELQERPHPGGPSMQMHTGVPTVLGNPPRAIGGKPAMVAGHKKGGMHRGRGSRPSSASQGLSTSADSAALSASMNMSLSMQQMPPGGGMHVPMHHPHASRGRMHAGAAPFPYCLSGQGGPGGPAPPHIYGTMPGSQNYPYIHPHIHNSQPFLHGGHASGGPRGGGGMSPGPHGDFSQLMASVGVPLGAIHTQQQGQQQQGEGPGAQPYSPQQAHTAQPQGGSSTSPAIAPLSTPTHTPLAEPQLQSGTSAPGVGAGRHNMSCGTQQQQQMNQDPSIVMAASRGYAQGWAAATAAAAGGAGGYPQYPVNLAPNCGTCSSLLA
uniref:RRM domain-containing protein n=1 Tax=Chromera velia CCMP2878 TaxID=1169474 RepID=A0A0G4HUU5_9ALVE|eukprot:Cvel_8701.t1-p1 / transcript=Cvel_8701.t1 / gene=Cvel_8701 / organism=Chromera_velia_CCMP2878 / gene_product=Polyadenylate-binding protein, cytoplasmic and, putative / transcript_product=Polyadenylate-binding protein, cytoplasmic and, putative / location=Cvel_scaffold485:77905-81080(-) / protein_length=645 / sequence_SO=supercontig / SO=protein_coding / is_pseudo=false